MQDQFGREIEYLRISVTDRCNLRCRYCMPEDGVKWLPHELILSFEEMLRLMRLSTQLGFRRFRITGGEPLIRKGILSFLREGARIPGVEDLMITTNGLLLPQLAGDIKEAGVQRVNISLDTMKPDRFRDFTRGGDVSKVMEGIFQSLEAGLNPVKVNVVVVRGGNTDELTDFANLAKEYPLHIRFIELMPIGVSSERRKDFFSVQEMKAALGLEGNLPEPDILGFGPAEYVQPTGFKGSLGFINALSRHFCDTCNRVRLTADGKLRTCLHSKTEVDLRTVLRNGSSDDEIKALMAQTIRQKPAKHQMNSETWQGLRIMSQIGG